MPRKKEADPAEKKRIRQARGRLRREERKKHRETNETTSLHVDDLSWLQRDYVRAAAMKIVNNFKERPYWLSIPHGKGDGNPPCVDFYPCTIIRTPERTFYGFLFRQHRDLSCTRLQDAERELTDHAPIRIS